MSLLSESIMIKIAAMARVTSLIPMKSYEAVLGLVLLPPMLSAQLRALPTFSPRTPTGPHLKQEWWGCCDGALGKGKMSCISGWNSVPYSISMGRSGICATSWYMLVCDMESHGWTGNSQSLTQELCQLFNMKNQTMLGGSKENDRQERCNYLTCLLSTY